MMLWDDFGGSDLWDAIRPRQGDDYPGSWIPLAVPSDRRHGANWPMWRTRIELDRLLQESRVRVEVNSYAKGLLRNLTNNVIGKGFAYKARPKFPNVDADPKTPGTQDPRQDLADKVQKVIDNFLLINRWSSGRADPRGCRTIAASREREIYRRLKRDGEAFLRFHTQDDGSTIIRFIEPEQIREGPSQLPQDGWSLGIKHRMTPFEDVEFAEKYCVFWPDPSATGGEGGEHPGQEDIIDAEDVLHLKGPDTDSGIKRGTPAFVYDVGRALDRASKLQRNASMGASVRAATAEIWQHETATNSQITTMAQGQAAYTRVDPSTGQNKTYERLGPGGIRRIPKGQSLVDLPTDQSESYLVAGQGDLRQAAASECAPEFWMAETSSGNYSNLESAAAPAVRAGQCEQEYCKTAFGLCVWRAVIASGKFGDDIADLITIDVEAPAVLHRNDLEKAQEDQIGVQVGWKDRQTCAEERGLDWDTVSQRNQEYNDRNAPEMGGLGLPGDEPGGAFGGQQQKPVKPPVPSASGKER